MTESASRPPLRSRLALVGLALSLAAGAVLYRLLVREHLEQTSALFIGVPAALAIFVALLPPARSAYGMTIRATTLALLMSGILLGEGFVCILFSAPLFYLVGLAVTSLVLGIRNSRDRRTQAMSCFALVPLLLSSAEGTHPSLTMGRSEQVTVERSVDAPVAGVEASLAAPPNFARLPMALQLGFPRPVRAEGSGLSIGDRRTVYFAGGEGSRGALSIEVQRREPGRVVFGFPSDESHYAHWLGWQSAEVTWQPTGPNRTLVRWTLRYERRLDPAWYFGPIEREFVRIAADYLIEALAGGG